MPKDQGPDLTIMTAQIVTNYLLNHDVETEDVPSLIQLVAQSLKLISYKQACSLVNHYGSAVVPAVPIEDSIQPDYLICLEDGRRMKMLKRHLKTAYNMTPEQYRMRWGLPANYPMTAPNYAQKRSILAKDFGLGNHLRYLRKVAG